jgi:hypothetical protein
MQAFYNHLITASPTRPGYWGWLAGLRRLTRAQTAALRSELAWEVWQTGAA